MAEQQPFDDLHIGVVTNDIGEHKIQITIRVCTGSSLSEVRFRCGPVEAETFGRTLLGIVDELRQKNPGSGSPGG